MARVVLTLGIIIVGLLGRAGLDKILALRGGAEWVAHWAQLSTVIDLVTAVAVAGVGNGLSVLVAQADRPARQHALLMDSLRLGLIVAIPAMLVVAALCLAFPRLLAGRDLAAGLLVLGSVAGCIGVIPGMVVNYWLGQQRRDLMFGYCVATSFVPAAVALGVSLDWLLATVTVSTALPAIVLAMVPRPQGAPRTHAEASRDRHALRRYVPVGLSIGVLSPGSMLAVRSIVGETMSWESAGHLQALWRASDWVAAVAGGVLSVYFLPRLSAAWGTPQFFRELRSAAVSVMVPSALALALLYALHGEVFELLYDRGFRLSDTAVALFFGGTLLRIAAWVPLFALFAMRRTLSISIGEFLSFPLFAVLLASFAEGLTLERAGLLWLASYLAFGAFNLWAMLRDRPKA